MDYPTMIDELLSCEEGLSAWELDFLDDVATNADCGIALTEKQEDKIEQIWHRVFG